MSASLDFGQGNASTLFYLENDSNQPIAIQVNLAKREMDENGNEKNPKIGDELTVYPSQLIIQPNEKKSIKVSWLNKFVPTKELSYRLIAEQLPIDMEKNKSKKASIKVLLKYVAALYVSGDNFQPNAVLAESIIIDDKINLVIDNSGSEHQVLNNLVLKYVSSKTKKENLVEGEDLKGMIGENVLAGSKRRFILNKSGKFAEIGKDDKVKISFDKE